MMQYQKKKKNTQNKLDQFLQLEPDQPVCDGYVVLQSTGSAANKKVWLRPGCEGRRTLDINYRYALSYVLILLSQPYTFFRKHL